ncbi:MAG: hypothetical protein AABY16_01610, partial [Nanoarchaeota archaeon]
QLKIEKPTKGCTVASCDTIDGPIVKLKNGSVLKVKSYDAGKKVLPQVSEILYLGDLLVPYGDFLNRNQLLCAPGYVEQYWKAELLEKGIEPELYVSFKEAMDLSMRNNVPMHPDYIYYWSQISYEQFLGLLDWIAHGNLVGGVLRLPYASSDRERFKNGKRALEIIGCEHNVTLEHVVFSEKDSCALLMNVGVDYETKDLGKEIDLISQKLIASDNVLDVLKALSKFIIKDKAGTFIGARMGRPEKAKLRKLTGSPHVLFPVGEEGGRLRSFQSSLEVGIVESDFPNYFCDSCKIECVYPRCFQCGLVCVKNFYCLICEKYSNDKCFEHPQKSVQHSVRKIDIKNYFESSKKLIGARIDDLPVVIKGVRGTSSEDHSCENLVKGM